MSTTCPKCRYKNPDETAFCGKCGTKFDAKIDHTKTLKALGIEKLIADKYQILEELGRGGMGIVYKANDVKLDRTVALKFLPPGVSHDKEAKKRFIQEAKAASGLDHTNICTIYEIGETEDKQMFIAMPYYEGKSLKEKMGQKPLEIDEAVSISTQIAEGLSRAHKKEIVHRDIKPANIMITEEGVVKIVDFGIAKLGGEVRLTQTGSTVGTTAYMSPEQTKGEKIDLRSDIWSLGVVLYEMLTGELPFKGEQMQSMVYSILNKDPESLSSSRSDIPSHIEKVVLKALVKEPEKRFQTAEELKQELKASPTLTFPDDEKSIVVLPFENLSPDKNQEYFCDGMTEEITSDLSKIHDLLVISRNSAMTFKGTKRKTKEIGKELNVQYVLEGSVRKASNNLRITAQLIDVKTDSHIWSEKYTGVLDDVFDIQERVSSSIAEQLKIKLSTQEISKIKAASLENVKAYDCYLQARYEITRGSTESFDRARHFLQRSLDIIGENAILYAMLGQVFYWYQDYGFNLDLDPLQEAEKYAKKAYALNLKLASTHFLLGLLERGKGNLKTAVQYIKNAHDVDPSDPYILSMFIWTTSAFTGKTKEMQAYAKELLDIDPVTPINYLIVGLLYMVEGQWDIAKGFVRKSVEMDPGFRWGYFWLAHILARAQNHKEFYEVADHLLEGDEKDIIADFIRFLRSTYEKDKKNALKVLTEKLKIFGWQDPECVWLMASCFALIDERDQALKWLERAIERGWINYPLFTKIDPFLENIRQEPEFKKLMERVKYEWENFEV